MKLDLEKNNLFLINKCSDNLFTEFLIDILKNNTINENIHIYSSKLNLSDKQEDIFYFSDNNIITIQNNLHVNSKNFCNSINNNNKFNTLFIIHANNEIEDYIFQHYNSVLGFDNKIILISEEFNKNFNNIPHTKNTCLKHIREKIINF